MKKVLLIVLVAFCVACQQEVRPNEGNGESLRGKSPAIQENEHLVFGFYSIFSPNPTFDVFKLEEESLYKDSKGDPTELSDTKPYPGNYNIDKSNQYEEVKNLLENVPDALLNDKRTVIGCPNCADQGGIYFEVKSGDMVKFWLIDPAIDQERDQVSEEVVEFVGKIKESLEILEQG